MRPVHVALLVTGALVVGYVCGRNRQVDCKPTPFDLTSEFTITRISVGGETFPDTQRYEPYHYSIDMKSHAIGQPPEDKGEIWRIAFANNRIIVTARRKPDRDLKVASQ